MRAIAAGVTDVGRERDHNEDRFVLLPEFEVFVVADGMGGHQCGEVASRMATSTIATYFRAHREQRGNGSISEVLRASLQEANQRIHRRAALSTIHRGMGTTVVAAAYSRHDEKLYVAHAGDSRCYLLRNGQLLQLTRDHSLVEEALRTRPDISRSELAYLPANVITRALGVEPIVDIDVTVETVRLGDVFLLCSDGLHGFVSDERLREIVVNVPVLTSACAELVAEANKNGGGDNITAVLIRIEELDEPWAVSTSVPPAPGKATPELDKTATATQPLPNIADANIAPGSGAEANAGDARAQIEADDTARVEAVTDPDAVLAGAHKDTDPGDE
jgi:protein phosphatase